MKKIFTTSALALLLGGIGFTANAATTQIQPTLLDPDSNTSTTNVIEVGEWWPNSVVITWDNETVKLNSENSNYVTDEYGSASIQNIQVSVNGVLQSETLNARPVYWATESWGGYFADADDDNPGTSIMIGGFPWFDNAPNEGEYMEFTIPAECFLIGTAEDYNAAVPVKLSVGEVDYDDSTIKTFGSQVTFSGSNQCQFQTRLNDTSNMCVVSNVSENLGAYISMTYDPGLGGNYIKEYNFNVVKMSNGNYAYNFENVTDGVMTFTYSGNTEVTFTFQQEWADGEQEGGLLQGGEIQWGVPFKAGPNVGQRFTYVVPEEYKGDSYIQIVANSTSGITNTNNIFSSGTFALLNSGDYDLISAWKSGTSYNVMVVDDTTYGITGYLNLSKDAIIYVVYTGNEEIEITIGYGLYTENGIPQYMEPATVSPTTISVSNTTAGIEFTWGDQEVTVREVSSMQIYKDGDVDGSMIELAKYMEFLSDEEGDVDSGDPDDPTTGEEEETFKAGLTGKVLLLKLGAALNNAPEVGTYTFTLPAGLVQNADGAMNPEQNVTITVVSPTVGSVSPSAGEAGPEFDAGEDVVFTISFDGTPVINESEDEPVVITGITDGEYAERLDWSDGVVYVDGNNVIVNLGNQMPAGAYYLNFMEGAVSVDGQGNELIENFRFVVNADETVVEPDYIPVYPTVTPDPKEDAVAPFTSVSISWEGYTLALNEDCETNATFVGEEVEGRIVNNALVFDVDAQEDGTYSMVVPAQYVIATDEDGNEYFNQSANYVFVVNAEASGISVIGNDANNVIFNLNGVRVNNNNLNKGIYIINGKKVVVK